MNLIEQLGGHDAAKKKYSERPHAFVWGDIGKALLSYRRAHNIFEVGDKIVYLSNIAPEHNDIYDVWEVGSIGCLVMLGGMDYRAMYNQIRHATDAEIGAGHRL